MAPADKSTIRWCFITAVVVIGVTLTAFLHDSVWTGLGVLKMRPYFADTVAILAAGDARNAGLDIYAAPNPFDPFGRPHVYGPGWLITGTLGLTVKDAPWVGAGLVLMFIAAAVAVLAPAKGAGALAALLLLCSPPVMLGINRANNDLVVFLLLAGAAWLLVRPRWWNAAAGGLLLAVAATLKLYPFAALPAILMRRDRWTRLVMFTTIVFVTCAVVAWVWRYDFESAMRIAPRPQTVFAYGLGVPLFTWNALPWRLDLMLGWAVGGVAGVALLAPRWRTLWNAVPTEGFNAIAFFAGAACWCFCFVANTNYPYRAVLLLLCARLWLADASGTGAARAGRVQLGLWIVVLWLALAKHLLLALIEPSARPRSFLLNPGTWFDFTCTAEQSLVMLLTVALGIGVCGALFRRLRTLNAKQVSVAQIR